MLILVLVDNFPWQIALSVSEWFTYRQDETKTIFLWQFHVYKKYKLSISVMSSFDSARSIPSVWKLNTESRTRNLDTVWISRSLRWSRAWSHVVRIYVDRSYSKFLLQLGRLKKLLILHPLHCDSDAVLIDGNRLETTRSVTMRYRPGKGLRPDWGNQNQTKFYQNSHYIFWMGSVLAVSHYRISKDIFVIYFIFI